MIKGLILSLSIVAISATTLLATVNYPFPQSSVGYGYGITAESVNESKITSDFKVWWNNFYDESGSLARIKYDEADKTVSEGIGYGMLMAVYMSDNTTSYQSQFDKLWAYYNNFLDNNGLMNWKINGFSDVSESGAATDAELDVAVALVMAYHQFGDDKYKTDALNLIHKIKQYEVDGDNVLQPGDSWNDKKNPSYCSLFGLGLFAEFDTENTSYWNTVASSTFSGVLDNQSSAGISSDWYNPSNPDDVLSTNFSYDAARTPWRIMLGYYWYGSSDAVTYLTKVATQFKNTAATDIKDGIEMNGSISGTYNNSTFVGGVGSVFGVSSSYQSKLNEYYSRLLTNGSDYDLENSYFSGALNIIYRLSMSGNMINFATAGSVEGVPVIDAPAKITIKVGDSFDAKTDIGYTSIDKEDGDITSGVTNSGDVNTSKAGNYTVTLSSTDSDGNTTTKDVIVVVDDGSTPLGYVILDDFENSMDDADNQTYLGARFNYYVDAKDNYYDAGHWFAFNDKADGGNSSATPDYITDKDFTGGLEQGGYNGSTQCLHVNIALGDGVDEYGTAYYGVGCNITEEGQSTDFTKMTDLSFYAKGSGKMRLKFKTEASDAIGTWGDMSYDFTLSSSWTKVTVNPSDIVPEPYSDDETKGLTWDDAKTAVHQLQFQTNGSENENFDFYIDDIVIDGMDYTDFEWGNHVVNSGTTDVPPTVEDITDTTDEDVAIDITLLGTSEDTTIASYKIVSEPLNGTVSITGAIATYTPNVDYFGKDSFTYKAIDANGLESDAGTVSITLTSVNDANPTAKDLSEAVDEDQILTTTISATDANSYESISSFAIIDQPLHGSVSLTGDVATFTPDENYFGEDSYTYTATDNDGGVSAQATVSITVNPINDLPVAKSGLTIETDEDVAGDVTLAGTDVEDGSVSSFKVSKEALNGTVSITGAVATYTPNSNYFGNDEFSFVAIDSDGAESEAVIVNVVVNSVNDQDPVTENIIDTTEEDVSGDITLKAIDDGTVTFEIIEEPTNGSVSLAGDVATYIPNKNYFGKDSFSYKATDNDGAGSNISVVNITVNPVNDIPIADNGVIFVDEDSSATFTLTGSDIDGTVEGFELGTDAVNGNAIVTDGVVTYTPNADFFGIDSFTVIAVDDSSENSIPASIIVTVKSINDGAPMADAKSISTKEDTDLKVTLSGDDVNSFESVVSFIIIDEPSHGEVTIVDGRATYIPDNGYFGDDYFTYKAIDNDGVKSEDAATVSVTVEKVVSVLDFSPSDQFNSDDLIVGPMPITKDSRVFYNVNKAGSYELELYTISENLVGSLNLEAMEGDNITTWSLLNTIPRGVYYIALKDNNKIIALTRVVKANR